MKLLKMAEGLAKKNKINQRDFDVSVLKDEFYMCIIEALKEFALSEDNKDIYALAFDCDSDVGVISLRYRNKQHFLNEMSEYEKYNKKYGWDIFGLHGSEYEPGEFPFIEYKASKLVKHFTDSYYYYEVGVYYGEDEPLEDIKDNYRELFLELVIETIERLKTDISQLGIDTTDNFIFFHCDHDQSYEDRDKMIRMTVDEEMIQRIGKLSADKNDKI